MRYDKNIKGARQMTKAMKCGVYANEAYGYNYALSVIRDLLEGISEEDGVSLIVSELTQVINGDIQDDCGDIEDAAIRALNKFRGLPYAHWDFSDGSFGLWENEGEGDDMSVDLVKAANTADEGDYLATWEELGGVGDDVLDAAKAVLFDRELCVETDHYGARVTHFEAAWAQDAREHHKAG